MDKKLVLLLTTLLVAALSCNLTGGSGEQSITPQSVSIGTLSRVSDAVQHNDNPVAGVDQLFENDSVRVFGGGEGLLDFGGGLLLRAFNDTILGGVTVASDPGAPLDVRMFLESGGFTGHLAAPGGKATIQTPGGATISVLGTEFLLVYDPASRLTTVGNFAGTLGVAAGGSSAVVASGHYREVPSGGQPGQELPLPFSQAEYEGRARDLRSPVLALEQPATQPPPTPTPTPTPTLTPTPTETVTTTVTPTQSPSPSPTYTPSSTLTSTTVINSGFITYRVQAFENTSIYLQGPEGPPLPLLTGKTDAEVLDYTPAGGLFAIWAFESGLQHVYIVSVDGEPVAGPLDQGWEAVVDADWSRDGKILVVEVFKGGEHIYYYYAADGFLIEQAEFPLNTVE